MKKQYVTPITEFAGISPVKIICTSIGAGGDGNGIPAEARRRERGCRSVDDLFDTNEVFNE